MTKSFKKWNALPLPKQQNDDSDRLPGVCGMGSGVAMRRMCHWNPCHCIVLLLACHLLAMTCQAGAFRVQDVEGLLDVTLAYGMGVRIRR